SAGRPVLGIGRRGRPPGRPRETTDADVVAVAEGLAKAPAGHAARRVAESAARRRVQPFEFSASIRLKRSGGAYPVSRLPFEKNSTGVPVMPSFCARSRTWASGVSHVPALPGTWLFSSRSFHARALSAAHSALRAFDSESAARKAIGNV